MARRHSRRSENSIHRQHGNSNSKVTRMPVPVKFLKSVCKKTIEEKKLRIPPRLVRNFEMNASGVAVLGFPNGFFVRVRLLKDNGKLFIDITKLVKNCHIREEFILEFTYKGFSNFEVYIFDPSMSYFQIEYPCNDASSSSSSSSSSSDEEGHSSSDEEGNSHLKQYSLHHYDVESDDDMFMNNDSSPPHRFEAQLSRREASFSKKNPVKSSVRIGLRDKKSGRTTVASLDNNKRRVLRRKERETRSKSQLEEEVVELSNENENSSELNNNEPPKTTTKRIRNAGEVHIATQKFNSLYKKLSENTKRAIDAANKVKSQNPSFQVIMRRYMFRSATLNIPSEFSKKYMNKVPERIRLVAPDRTEWLVTVRVTQLGYMNFGNGWSNFFRHNHYKEGDVCLFELIRSRPFTLKVAVFRS